MHKKVKISLLIRFGFTVGFFLIFGPIVGTIVGVSSIIELILLNSYYSEKKANQNKR